MNRASKILLAIMAAAASAAAQQTAPAPTPAPAASEPPAAPAVDASNVVLAPRAPALRRRSRPTKARAGRSRREIAADLASGMPKYAPPTPTPATTAEPQDLRDIDKPRNEIRRLPKYVVRETRPPVFRDRDLYNTKGLVDLSFKSHPGLVVGNFLGLNSKRGLRDVPGRPAPARTSQDLTDTAHAMALGGDKAESDYILKESQETYMRPIEETWAGPGGGGGILGGRGSVTETLILRELLAAEPGWVSGGVIASKLGVSRVSVWHQMEKLRSQGFAFEALPAAGLPAVQAAEDAPRRARGGAAEGPPQGLHIRDPGRGRQHERRGRPPARRRASRRPSPCSRKGRPAGAAGSAGPGTARRTATCTRASRSAPGSRPRGCRRSRSGWVSRSASSSPNSSRWRPGSSGRTTSSSTAARPAGCSPRRASTPTRSGTSSSASGSTSTAPRTGGRPTWAGARSPSRSSRAAPSTSTG